MDIIAGEKVNSKGYCVVPNQAVSPRLDVSSYEAKISDLFMPWLVEEIPDSRWVTLQKNLGLIIRDISRKNNKEITDGV
jgi:hypothetical protein